MFFPGNSERKKRMFKEFVPKYACCRVLIEDDPLADTQIPYGILAYMASRWYTTLLPLKTNQVSATHKVLVLLVLYYSG